MKTNLFENSQCVHVGLLDFSILEKLFKEHDKRYFMGCIKCNSQLLNSQIQSDQEEIWICLDCLVAGCGRNSKGHALSHFNTLSQYSSFHNLSIGLRLNIYCYKCQIDIVDKISLFKDDRQTNFIIQIQKIFFEGLNKKDICFRSTLNIEKKDLEIGNKLQSEIILPSLSKTTIYSTKNKDVQKIYCFKGLVNNKNTCFFNSIIQCLNNNPLIASKILNNEDAEYFNEEKPSHLKQFLIKIRTKVGHQNDPKELFEKTLCVFHKKFLGYQQQDAHEAFIILMDGLIEENKSFFEKMKIENKAMDQTFFGKYFSSKLIHKIYCLNCKKNYIKIDDFIDLSLAIDNIVKKPIIQLDQNSSNLRYIKENLNGEVYFLPNKIRKVDNSLKNLSQPKTVTNIEEALSLFFEKEQLEENELFKCQECNKPQEAIREFYLAKCPLILVLHLKRFSGSSYSISKCSKKVDFSENLSLEGLVTFKQSDLELLGPDMINYVNESLITDLPNKIFNYTLYGVVVHNGNMHKGNYFSYVKDLFEQKWYYISDSFVHETNKITVLKSEAYMLFYIKESEIKL